MISITILLIILFWHWLVDFVVQTDWQAKNKSIDNDALCTHTCVYALSWVVPLALIDVWTNLHTGHWAFTIPHVQVFILFTLIAHTITDYFTSRLNTHLWKKGDVHNFFVSVGFDQFLHYLQLIVTYQLLLG